MEELPGSNAVFPLENGANSVVDSRPDIITPALDSQPPSGSSSSEQPTGEISASLSTETNIAADDLLTSTSGLEPIPTESSETLNQTDLKQDPVTGNLTGDALAGQETPDSLTRNFSLNTPQELEQTPEPAGETSETQETSLTVDASISSANSPETSALSTNSLSTPETDSNSTSTTDPITSVEEFPTETTNLTDITDSDPITSVEEFPTETTNLTDTTDSELNFSLSLPPVESVSLAENSSLADANL